MLRLPLWIQIKKLKLDFFKSLCELYLFWCTGPGALDIMHLSMSNPRGGDRATHGNLTVMHIPRVGILTWHHVFDLSILKGRWEVNHLFLLILTIILCPGVGVLRFFRYNTFWKNMSQHITRCKGFHLKGPHHLEGSILEERIQRRSAYLNITWTLIKGQQIRLRSIQHNKIWENTMIGLNKSNSRIWFHPKPNEW